MNSNPRAGSGIAAPRLPLAPIRRTKQKRLQCIVGAASDSKGCFVFRNRSAETRMLEQPERHLNRHLRRNTLAARSDRRPELPLPYGFNRFLVQSQARALYNLYVRSTPI